MRTTGGYLRRSRTVGKGWRPQGEFYPLPCVDRSSRRWRKVKRLLRKHGYPPDKREEAVVTVIEQAEAVCRDWADAA